MKDANFISERIERGKQALEKFEKELSSVNREQLNWKPSSKSWSIAECLEHLRISDNSYFNDLQEIGNGNYQMSYWERYSPLSPLFGKMLKALMEEKATLKIATHEKLIPKSSDFNLSLLEQYKKNLNKFIDLVSQCSPIDLDKCIINSPTLPWITYSLRDALHFLFEHEHRHLNQAIRVKNSSGFPSVSHNG